MHRGNNSRPMCASNRTSWKNIRRLTSENVLLFLVHRESGFPCCWPRLSKASTASSASLGCSFTSETRSLHRRIASSGTSASQIKSTVRRPQNTRPTTLPIISSKLTLTQARPWKLCQLFSMKNCLKSKIEKFIYSRPTNCCFLYFRPCLGFGFCSAVPFRRRRSAWSLWNSRSPSIWPSFGWLFSYPSAKVHWPTI